MLARDEARSRRACIFSELPFTGGDCRTVPDTQGQALTVWRVNVGVAEVEEKGKVRSAALSVAATRGLEFKL